MTHVTHSKMLKTRRRNQARKKQIRLAAKQAHRKSSPRKAAPSAS